MAAKKATRKPAKKAAPRKKAGIEISNCSIVAESGKLPDYNTANAVIALARACESHGHALVAIANKLQGTPGSIGYGIYVGAPAGEL